MSSNNYKCSACDFVYEEPRLLEDSGSFAELAHDWRCPSCGADKDRFWREGYANNPVLQRHISLKPLARDHGVELVCVQSLQKASRSSAPASEQIVMDIRTFSSQTILPYLEDEHRILSTTIPGHLIGEFSHKYNQANHALSRLSAIEKVEDLNSDLLSRAAAALDEYVRWEEHVLYPEIEGLLSESELKQLSEKTEEVEGMRKRPTQRLHCSVAHGAQIANST